MLLYWMRNPVRNRMPRKVQFLSLAMVVALLLPVISLSDDLMAMQGPSETDSCVRRVLHVEGGHPSVIPASTALPEQIFIALSIGGYALVSVDASHQAVPSVLLMRSLYSRPPPQA